MLDKRDPNNIGIRKIYDLLKSTIDKTNIIQSTLFGIQDENGKNITSGLIDQIIEKVDKSYNRIFISNGKPAITQDISNIQDKIIELTKSIEKLTESMNKHNEKNFIENKEFIKEKEIELKDNNIKIRKVLFWIIGIFIAFLLGYLKDLFNLHLKK